MGVWRVWSWDRGCTNAPHTLHSRNTHTRHTRCMQTLHISLHLAEQHGVAEVTHRLGRREARRATAAAEHARERCRGDEGGPRCAAPRRLGTDESCQRTHRLHRRGLAGAGALAATVSGAEAEVGRTQQRARGAQRGIDGGGGRGGNCGGSDGGGDANRLSGVAQSEVEQAEQPRRRRAPDRCQPHRDRIVGECSAQHPRDADRARRRGGGGGDGRGLRVSCECVDRGLALRLVEALERAPAQRSKGGGVGFGRGVLHDLGARGWRLGARG